MLQVTRLPASGGRRRAGSSEMKRSRVFFCVCARVCVVLMLWRWSKGSGSCSAPCGPDGKHHHHQGRTNSWGANANSRDTSMDTDRWTDWWTEAPRCWRGKGCASTRMYACKSHGLISNIYWKQDRSLVWWISLGSFSLMFRWKKKARWGVQEQIPGWDSATPPASPSCCWGCHCRLFFFSK